MTSPEVAGRRPGAPAGVTADQFRLLVAAVRDYAIFLLDLDGRVVSWNAGAERIKGYTAAEILGQHFSRFYEPEDVAAGKPTTALALAARDGRVEWRGWRVRKDGSRFFAQITITALTDDEGRPRGFAKITRDVTAERDAEAALLERDRQLAEAQAIARLGSFEWDLTADEVRWSPELYRILGVAPGSVAVTLDGFLQRVHPDDRDDVATALRQAALDGTPFQAEARVVRASGEPRILSGWGEAVHDEGDRPVRVRGVWQDVTAWRHREEQLVEAHAQAELSRRLQQGLLPSLSLADPALALHTRYQAGHERALLGADFYDALDLPDGTVALLIGDVAGHGPDGAAVGVALRAAWQALILTGHGPADLLGGLDRVLVANRPSEEMFTTVCCCWIGPDRDRITVALAGHPPPLLVRSGAVEAVVAPAGPALGVLDCGGRWEAEELEVDGAWMLLCYTDGLVEGRRAPGSVERFGIDAVATAVADLAAAGAPPDRLLDELLDRVHEANGGDLSDDVAILCVVRPGDLAIG